MELKLGWLLLAAVAAAKTSDKPWKARTAAASSWAGARVALLWRGMHYGSYKSERHRNKIIHRNVLEITLSDGKVHIQSSLRGPSICGIDREP